jgi:HSP20 family molecular chaperone IbpA
MPTTRKTSFFRMTMVKGAFYNTRTLNRARTKQPRATLFPHIPSLTKERKPLVDIFEEQDHLIVLAELPGIDEKDLNIKADKDTLTISTENKTPKYLKKVHLPAFVKKNTAKSTYKNNILQIKLKKLNTITHT